MGEKAIKEDKKTIFIKRKGLKIKVTSNEPSELAIKNFNKFYNKHFDEFNK